MEKLCVWIEVFMIFFNNTLVNFQKVNAKVEAIA
jgi:hypothetical protein